jgi:hypothetical protein
MMQTSLPQPVRRNWLARGAAVFGLCLAWGSCLGAATVWPRWNRVQMLRMQARERQAEIAGLQDRLNGARLAVGTDAVSQARDRALSRDEVAAFIREVRERTNALGGKVVALDRSESAGMPGSPATLRARLVAEGRFPQLYELLRYLEHRRVFVAVDRAEVAPLAADGRLKAVLQFQVLVAPAAAGPEERA